MALNLMDLKSMKWGDIEELVEELSHEQQSIFAPNGQQDGQDVQQDVGWVEVKKKQKKFAVSDKHLVCVKCQDGFEFKVEQQLKYKKANWAEPKICWKCQKARYAERNKNV